ncbi:hypothetical protein B0H13DRAFT_1852571 [Mycena leptocephala]|nr:hypothetical protein B0H13DRAFT_1879964 [Mycena leptocephala]KAJ7908014.1 hypothetical protein B0H13DRAFT_1879015 [Mycena leptocephala]KAJ7929489.1 hypothetical protein B0H13DRAFT_1859699 [Mycena leptocephala]KAJ7937599.1 hypothetical protein B0H13DRAFT_1852571 [Mycena leptocephala]
MDAGSALGERMHLALELAGLALPIESLVLRRDLGEANTIDEVLGGAGGSRRSVTRSSRGRGRYWGGIRRSAICSIGGRGSPSAWTKEASGVRMRVSVREIPAEEEAGALAALGTEEAAEAVTALKFSATFDEVLL